jgi:hypothetical protein
MGISYLFSIVLALQMSYEEMSSQLAGPIGLLKQYGRRSPLQSL